MDTAGLFAMHRSRTLVVILVKWYFVVDNRLFQAYKFSRQAPAFTLGRKGKGMIKTLDQLSYELEGTMFFLAAMYFSAHKKWPQFMMAAALFALCMVLIVKYQ